MFFEPNRTQFDLNWRMFGIHCRVHPWFWIMSVLLGQPLLSEPQYLILWVLCVFVSILLHELGHVFVGRLFGSHGHIVLYSFGGLAIGSNKLSARWQRIMVCLGGPLIQLVLFCLLLLVDVDALRGEERPVPPVRRLTILGLFFLKEINLIWPLMNLLPVWPLDGGQICREVCAGVRGERGIRLALWISVIVAGLIAVYSLAPARLLDSLSVPWYLHGDMFTALLFGLLAVSSYMTLQQLSRHEWRDDFGERDDGDWR